MNELEHALKFSGVCDGVRRVAEELHMTLDEVCEALRKELSKAPKDTRTFHELSKEEQEIVFMEGLQGGSFDEIKEAAMYEKIFGGDPDEDV